MRRLWVVQRTNKEFVDYLSRAAQISPALAQIFINRGIRDPQSVTDFLEIGLSSMIDPFELRGMRECVELIKKAKDNHVLAFVHGDYDVDGISSTAILVDTLRRFGLEVRYFIPNRFTHGYGFHEDCVRKALAAGAGLIITTDCGITAFETVEFARKSGIEVIITDHHEPARDPEGNPLLPNAACVINPKLTPGEPELSGTGVVFKMSQALLGDDALMYLDLAALGTVADLVPLLDENRIIAKEGLAQIGNTKRPAIKALKTISFFNREVNARTLCFTLIPRLNAPGRLEDASDAVKFLLSESEGEAMEGAENLDRINRERQRIEEVLYNDARAELERQGFEGAIVLSGPAWHKGILGIVASRLSEEFYRPAIILSIDGEVARGSARSIPEFDLYEGLSELKDYLVGFGGHRQAAGLRIRTDKIDEFRTALSRLVMERVPEFRPTLKIDADVCVRDVNFNLVREFSRLEPFGFGNQEPLLGAKGLEVISPRVVGNGHLKLKLRHRKQNQSIDAIGFDMAGTMNMIEENFLVDIAFVPQINEWDGGRVLQLVLKGLRPAANL